MPSPYRLIGPCVVLAALGACDAASTPPASDLASASATGAQSLSTASASDVATKSAPATASGERAPEPDPALVRALDEALDALESTPDGAPTPLPGQLRQCFPLPGGPLAKAAATAWKKDVAEHVDVRIEGDTAFVSIGTIKPANPTLCLAKQAGVWKLVGYIPGA